MANLDILDIPDGVTLELYKIYMEKCCWIKTFMYKIDKTKKYDFNVYLMCIYFENRNNKEKQTT